MFTYSKVTQSKAKPKTQGWKEKSQKGLETKKKKGKGIASWKS
jgi:hypothetical protein